MFKSKKVTELQAQLDQAQATIERATDLLYGNAAKYNRDLDEIKKQLAEKKALPTEEEQIKQNIIDRALAMAEDTYKKDVMFRSLQASDLHYAIIEDLMKAAQLTGQVVVKLKDGTEIRIESKGDRNTLNSLDGQLF